MNRSIDDPDGAMPRVVRNLIRDASQQKGLPPIQTSSPQGDSSELPTFRLGQNVLSRIDTKCLRFARYPALRKLNGTKATESFGKDRIAESFVIRRFQRVRRLDTGIEFARQ